MEYFLNTKASGERIGKICGQELMIEHACTITEIKELLMILCHIFCSGFSSYWLPGDVSQTTKMHVAGVREAQRKRKLHAAQSKKRRANQIDFSRICGRFEFWNQLRME